MISRRARAQVLEREPEMLAAMLAAEPEREPTQELAILAAMLAAILTAEPEREPAAVYRAGLRRAEALELAGGERRRL